MISFIGVRYIKIKNDEKKRGKMYSININVNEYVYSYIDDEKNSIPQTFLAKNIYDRFYDIYDRFVLELFTE